MKKDVLVVTTGLLSLSLAGCNGSSNDTVEPSVGDGWALVWSDEFDGAEIDSEKWNHEKNCWGGGNAEQQCYVDDAKNSFVQDGKLTIRVIKGDTTGPDSVEGSDGYGETLTTLPYSSARLRTMNNGDWKYGRFEVRAKLPLGQGTWPAIWMLPTDYVYGGWAASGEIDIMEAVNLGTTYQHEGVEKRENRVHGTLHYGKAWPNNVYSGEEYDFGDENISPADDFHTYAIEWEQGEIRWYVDDVHYATQTSEGWWSHYQDDDGNWISGTDDAPYNQKFHLILNLAMGGSWPSSVNDGGIDETIEQAEMQVDYVRIYQCSVDPETGKGCATPASGDAVTNEGVEEPDFPKEVDLSAMSLPLFANGDLLDGFNLNGWDDSNNDTRTIADNLINISIIDNGNAYIESLNGALDMADFIDGELSFDLNLVSGNASALSVKMDSGYPALAPIDIPFAQLPAVDEWKSFTFPVNDFIAAGTNGFSINGVSNPVVFEPVNNVDLAFKVDNLIFTKPLVIAADSIVEGFILDGYTADAPDSRNFSDGMLDAQFSGAGNLFFTAESALDMSRYANWVLKFDINIVDLGSNSDVLIKMDSGWPNVSDIALADSPQGLLADGQWHTYAIPVIDFIAAENRFSPGSQFDVNSVTNPFVLEGLGGENLHVKLRNIRFVAP
ncbi:family 16 glycosylhydrolase [Vibrio rotiferianus]|uniref:family 16 glycosylhydrolase n=1 Tax=Vibrio rotiferianus TaxID=190895 RepID=UPI00406A76CB